MGQFRWMAAVALLTASAASAANLGTFYIGLSQVETRTVFERHPQLGTYIQQTDETRFELTMQGQNIGQSERSKPLSKIVEFKIENIDNASVSIRRRGDTAELQFYTVVMDPNILMKVPIIESRRISLKPGYTWQQYDADQTVEAVITDEREVEENKLMLTNLGNLYFDQVIREILSTKNVIAQAPVIEITEVPQRTFEINKKRIIMSTKGGTVQIRSNVQGTEPRERKKATTPLARVTTA